MSLHCLQFRDLCLQLWSRSFLLLAVLHFPSGSLFCHVPLGFSLFIPFYIMLCHSVSESRSDYCVSCFLSSLEIFCLTVVLKKIRVLGHGVRNLNPLTNLGIPI